MPTFQPKLNLVVEGETDRVVLTELLHSRDFTEIEPYVKGGKGELLKRLDSYNQAARYSPWLVVLDLDRDAACAPDYLKRILPQPKSNMILRIAVHSIETWLMADQEMMARFLSIPVREFPASPDRVTFPKRFLVNLVQQKCPPKLRRSLVEEMTGNRDLSGPGYRYWINRFAARHWRPEVAAQRSDSLARCIRALKDLKRQSAR
ncbi:MAG: hypothetical protein OXB89_07970 [Anaerolineaceae bacterium]|nr:hypothetical protein [Anaerolineaceae bacterium]